MFIMFVFFFHDTAPTEIYTYCHTLSLHDALPISRIARAASAPERRDHSRSGRGPAPRPEARCAGRHRPSAPTSPAARGYGAPFRRRPPWRSEEHTSELQSLMRISYAVFCLKKKTYRKIHKTSHTTSSKTTP